MEAETPQLSDSVEALVSKVRGLLDSQNARDRVDAIRHLAVGVTILERQVLRDAQAAGMTWAAIGDVYGVTRQAAHRRFADETVVSSDQFDALLAELDGPPEVVPALAAAAVRSRRATQTR